MEVKVVPQKFSDFDDLNYLQKNSNEDIGDIWKYLLNYLNNEVQKDSDNLYPFWRSFIDKIRTGQSQFFNDITDQIVMSGNVVKLKEDMVASLASALELPIQIDTDDIFLKSWYNRPWNDSVARLMMDYYFALDMAGAERYEGDSLYINEDGTIDIEKTRGTIKVNDSNIRIRVSDIKNANAGNSFDRESETWEFINYITSFDLIVSSVEYIEDDIKKKEYFDQPLVLTFNREQYLKNYPQQYTNIYYKEKERGSCLESIIECLNGTNVNGWLVSDAKIFIDQYNPTITSGNGGDAQKFIQEKEGNYYLRGAYNEKISKLRHFIKDSLWVIPWYNIDGKTYRLIRGNDINLSAICLGKADDREVKNQGKYYLDFTRKYSNNTEDNKWIRLLMPQYKRRIEVEDLNRNFWVIAQTISTLAAYLFDPEGPYSKMIGGLLNEIMQIWENILFMWAELAAQDVKQFDTITKVVYISPENLSDYLSYDDFDFYDVWNQYNMIRSIYSYEFAQGSHIPTAVNVINRIPILGRTSLEDPSGNNNAFEEVVIKYLKEYRKKFANKNVNLIPVVRLDNYENNNFSRIIIPGIYRYFISNEELYNKAQQEHRTMPIGELGTDGVFRTDTASIGDADPRSLNCYKESFLGIVNNLGSEYRYYRYDISTDGFERVIAGIYEKISQDGYGAVNYLVLADTLKTASQEKVYGLIKPVIRATGEGVADEFMGAEKITIEIEAYDLAKYFMETGNELDDNGYIKIGEDNYVIYRQCYPEDNSVIIEPIDKSIDRNSIYSTGNNGIAFTPVYNNNINGTFGYYLGELLSTKRNSSQLTFNVINLKERELQPSWVDKDLYKRWYGHTDDIDINNPPVGIEHFVEMIQTIHQDEEDDKNSLINAVRNVYDRWRLNSDPQKFWKERETELSNISGEKWNPEIQSIRVGYYPQNVKNTTPPTDLYHSRSDVYKNYLSSEFVWKKNADGAFELETWKNNAWDDLNDILSNEKLKEEMTESTILFITGKRTTGWKDDLDQTKDGEYAYAKDGLVHWRYPSPSTQKIAAGAAVRIPVGDGDGQYGFYPIHTSPTNADIGWRMDEFTCGINQIWRSENLLNNVVIPNDGTIKDDDGKKLNIKDNEAIYENYKNQTLMYSIDGTIYPRFDTVESSTAHSETNYFVLRREGEDFNENNWLIEQVDAIWYTALCLFKWYKNGNQNLKGINLLMSNFESTEDTSIDSMVYTTGEVGALDSIRNVDDYLDEYYKHTYQKHVWWKINKEWDDIKKTTCTLSNAFTEFNLINKLFGWIRIMDLQGAEIITLGFPYNNPIEYIDKTTENVVKIIENLRSQSTFAGVIKNGINDEKDGLSLLQLKELMQFFGFNLSENDYIYMGSFCKRYSGSPHTSHGTQETYYEDRIMGFYTGVQMITQRDLIYRNQRTLDAGDIRQQYIKAIENCLNVHKEKWYDSNLAKLYKNLAKFITPQDNDESARSYYSIKLYLPNPDIDSQNYIELKDKLLVDPQVVISEAIYIFGPEENGKYKYARRGIYRYPFDSVFPDNRVENIAVNQWIKNNDPTLFGTWPDRPLDRTVNDAPLWKDDYYLTGQDIDLMRDGYVVVSATNAKENQEKYKSRYSKKNEEKYAYECGRLGTTYTIDDNDTQIWDYPEYRED